MPPGSGVRAGLDRDEDGAFDRDEMDGTDPGDPELPFSCGGGAHHQAHQDPPHSRRHGDLLGSRRATLPDPIDPAGSGLLLAVSDAGGPGSPRRRLRQHRMQRRPGGGRWIFNDSLATAATGITRVVLRERSNRPGVFVFRIDAAGPGGPAGLGLPAQFAIRIGRASACATTAFAPLILPQAP